MQSFNGDCLLDYDEMTLEDAIESIKIFREERESRWEEQYRIRYIYIG